MNDAKVRVFVSSPADVEHERVMVKDILERLAQEFLPYFQVDPILWEEEALTADRTFQAGMVRPSECDIVLVVLWSRLGSPLPQDPYQGRTGTEWEFFDGVEASAAGGRPEVLVYKKTNPKLVDITNPQQTQQAVEDRKRLEEFFRSNFFNDDQTFRRAFRTFDSDAAFRSLVEGQLRKLLNRRIFVERRGPGRAFDWHGNPFRAHAPFGFGDERVFTGRESETRELLSRLHEQAVSGDGFLLLSGASGSGKTSLVRAGLLPRLVRPHQVPGVAACRWCLVDPSVDGDPMPALARALCAREVLGDVLAGFGVDSDILRKGLSAAPGLAVSQIHAALLTLTRAFVDDTGDTDAAVRLTVVVDPLEPLLVGEHRASHRAFFEALAALARSGSVWVVALVRSDRLRDLAGLGSLDDLVHGRGWFRLEPVPASRSRQVIEIPALVAGLSYESDAGHSLPELLEAQAAGLRLWPPLIQGTLERLFQGQTTAETQDREPWDRGRRQPGRRGVDREAVYPSVDGLRSIGGLAGDALRRAERVWAACDDDTRAALPRLCRALIGLERLGARHPVPRVADLDLLESEPASYRLVQALIDARLLIAEGERDPALLIPCEAPDYSFRAWFGRAVRDTRAGWSARLAPEGERESGALAAAQPEASGVESGQAQDWQNYRRNVSLVHPELMQLWGPMAAWIERPENREALVLRGQIARQTRLWKRTDCNREYLLGESGFAAATRFAGVHPGELEPGEVALLVQSGAYLRAQRRGKRLVRATGLVLVSLLALVTIAAQWAWDASRTANVNLHRSRLKAAGLAVSRGNTPSAVVSALDAFPYLPRQAAEILSRALTGSHLVALAHEGPPLVGLPLSAALDESGEGLLTADPVVGVRPWRLEGFEFRPESDAYGAELGIHSVLFAGDGPAGGFLGIAPDGVRRFPRAAGTQAEYPCGAESGALHALAPGGRRLALSRALTPDSYAVCMLDLERPGEVAFDLALHEGEIRSLVFSPDGTRLLTAGRDGRAKVLDAADGRVLLALPLEGPLRRVLNRAVFDPGGGRIALAASDGRLRVFGPDGTLIRQLAEVEAGGVRRRVHDSEVRDLAFSPDGDFLVAVDDGGQVVRWGLTGAPSAFVLGHHEGSVELVRIAAAGERVLTASTDGTARLWDLETGRQLAIFSHDGAVSDASFTDDGRRVLTLSAQDGTVRLWDVGPVPRLGRFMPHGDHVRHVTFASLPGSGSLRLATASSSGLVRVWDLAAAEEDAEIAEPLLLSGHDGGVRRVDFSADAMRLASAAQDGTARVWDLTPGDVPERALCRLPVADEGGSARVARALFDPSPQPRWLLTASDQPRAPLRLWDPDSCAPLEPEALTQISGAGVQAVAVRRRADGVLVAVGSNDGRVRVLFAADDGTWSTRCDLRRHTRPVLDLDISPDGSRVASASEDHWARVLSVSSCGDASSVDLVGHTDTLRSVRFSADGRRLVTASLDGTARVWTERGELIAILADHGSRVYHAAFGVGDRFILTASRDGALRIWQNPEAGVTGRSDADLVFSADFGGVAYAAFSPDGRFVAAGYWRNQAALWRLLDSAVAGEAAEKAALRAGHGETFTDLAVIGEARRFRRDNRLDALLESLAGDD